MVREGALHWYIIEDSFHAQWLGERYASFEEALAVVREWSLLPWDAPPNCAPCVGWQQCGRTYEIVAFDQRAVPWVEISRVAVLSCSAEGMRWQSGAHADGGLGDGRAL